jgi:hypothetical protein
MNTTEQGDTVLSNGQVDDIARVPEEDVIVYDSDDWIIVIPKTHNAAIYWGQNSEWDTSWKGGKMWFDIYSASGDLIIIKHKHNPDQHYQFHIEKKLFFDRKNISVIFAEFFSQHIHLREAVIHYLQDNKEILDQFEILCHK